VHEEDLPPARDFAQDGVADPRAISRRTASRMTASSWRVT